MQKKVLRASWKLILVIFLCVASGCEKPYNPIPHPVPPLDFKIYPNDVLFLNLNYYGGHEYFTGGIKGVIVYRLSEYEFTAFDRACPFDWDEPDEPYVVVEDDGITMRCRKCKSLFNILDGGVIDGPARYPLRQYYTKYDGMILRVHS
jgi:nitrite reductase/ring-hydroxylating ferredoxin subunit